MKFLKSRPVLIGFFVLIGAIAMTGAAFSIVIALRARTFLQVIGAILLVVLTLYYFFYYLIRAALYEDALDQSYIPESDFWYIMLGKGGMYWSVHVGMTISMVPTLLCCFVWGAQLSIATLWAIVIICHVLANLLLGITEHIAYPDAFRALHL